jgi:hypothetical protein
METADVEARLESFLAKYTQEIRGELVRARSRMRASFPRGFELVYDNYNALVLGYGPTARASDAVLSLAAYPRWVTLFFLHGISLTDPSGLLQGSGKQVRSIRLRSAEDLDSPAVVALVVQAAAAQRMAFEQAPRLTTVVKSVSKTQRPRRPAPR